MGRGPRAPQTQLLAAARVLDLHAAYPTAGPQECSGGTARQRQARHGEHVDARSLVAAPARSRGTSRRKLTLATLLGARGS